MNGRDAVRVLLSALLLAAAWRIADGERVLDVLASASVPWLALALLLTIPMQVLSAMRWRFTSTRLGAPLTLRTAIGEYYLASLLNMTLPGGIAGDLARAWRQGRAAPPQSRGHRRSIHGVVLERSAGQVTLLAVLLAGLSCNTALRESLGVGRWLAPAAAVAVVAVAALVLAARRWRTIEAFALDARHAFTPLPVFTTQAALSLAVIATYLAVFAATAAALRAPLPPAAALVAIPLVLTAMALPISVGGTGPRELSAAALWPVLQMDAASGAATALTYGMVVIAGSLPGAVMLVRARDRGLAPGG